MKTTTKIIISLFSLVFAFKAIAVISTYFMLQVGYVEANAYSAWIYSVYGLEAGLAICFFAVVGYTFIPILTYFAPFIMVNYVKGQSDKYALQLFGKTIFFVMASLVLVILVVATGSDAIHNLICAATNGETLTWVFGI
jgi:hypothetical protein